MSLFTKCILNKASPDDGLRISVMSRHTQNDGITPDSRITEKLYHVHMKILGPSPKLVGSHYKRGLPWSDFEEAYLLEIREPTKVLIVKKIARLALETDITFLCIEDDATECHRRLLAEECQRHQPKLRVLHR